MPRRLVLAMIVASAATAVEAADIYDRGPPPGPDYGIVTDPQVFSWTGLTVGAHAGYGWGTAHNRLRKIGGFRNHPSGVVGGLFLGFNQMLTHSLVAGVEADVSLSAQEERHTVAGVGTVNAHDWYGTLRGRFGVAFDRVMPFVTAGVAFGDVDVRVGRTRRATAAIGWTVGGGIEGAITPHLIARAEYQYLDFGSEAFGRRGLALRTDAATHVLRAGLGYKF